MSSKVLNIFADAEKHVNRIVDEVHAAVDDTVNEGVAVMSQNIATRETGRTWSKTYYKEGIPRSASINGRIWTSRMINSVDGYQDRTGNNSSSAFGWIEDQEPYFLDQEEGFMHPTLHVWIEGMYALQDAREYAIDYLEQRLKAIK